MTCKDCIHFKVCEYEGVYFEDVAIEASSADGIESLCPLFENKADFVKVVRCKNCDIPHNKWTGCPKLNGLIPPPNHFCSYGERKEE